MREMDEQQMERLHTFLNAAAGDGLVLDGVDAADLYVDIFPQRYAATVAQIHTGEEHLAIDEPCKGCFSYDCNGQCMGDGLMGG